MSISWVRGYGLSRRGPSTTLQRELRPGAAGRIGKARLDLREIKGLLAELGKVRLHLGATHAIPELLHNNGQGDPGAWEHRLPRADGRIAFHKGMRPLVETIPITQIPAHAAQIEAQGNGACPAQLTAITGPPPWAHLLPWQAPRSQTRRPGQDMEYLPLLVWRKLQALGA